MIQANSLRQGNHLHFIVKPKKDDERPELVTVTEILKKGIKCDYQGVSMMFEKDAPDMVGIPLSPEILLKCSTLVNKITQVYRIELPDRPEILFIKLNEVGNGKSWSVTMFSFGTSKKMKDVYYLHEIQNLYHSLTGSEIKLSL